MNQFNIDDNDILGYIINIIDKYKVLIGIILFLIITCIITSIIINDDKSNDNNDDIIVEDNSNNSNEEVIVSNTLTLNGEEVITIYRGTEYIEPGYDAYNIKNQDISSAVTTTSNLDIEKIGEYQITYKLYNITKTRTIHVIANPNEHTIISLNKVDDNVDVYLMIGEKYKEPGYEVINSLGLDLNNRVKVEGVIDNKTPGIYELTYSLVDNNENLIIEKRKVIVIDIKITLTQNIKKNTNKDVTINIKVDDNYFDYIMLPNKTKIREKNYNYTVKENGTYTFVSYNKASYNKKATIKITNIDKVPPTGNCYIKNDASGLFIEVNANDNVGINKYVYNNQEYKTNKIRISTIPKTKLSIYDEANNNISISCKNLALPIINSITNDGIIVKVNASKAAHEISGYYFSYTNVRPNKSSGGYLATSNTSVDVVRLAGTTYVWVEDVAGNISESKSITLSSNLLLRTNNDKYSVLTGIALSDYLNNKGWSIQQLNNLLARSVRASNMYSGEAAATSAVALQTVLAQKYKIVLPYESAGLHTALGAKSTWGKYGFNYITDTNVYYGLDCSAFLVWAYENAGYNFTNRPYFWGSMPRIKFSKENGEIGDILVMGWYEGSRHVKLIIGKIEDGFITAESTAGKGMVVDIHRYDKPEGYEIEKASNITEKYTRFALNDYPSGF